MTTIFIALGLLVAMTLLACAVTIQSLLMLGFASDGLTTQRLKQIPRWHERLVVGLFFSSLVIGVLAPPTLILMQADWWLISKVGSAAFGFPVALVLFVILRLTNSKK